MSENESKTIWRNADTGAVVELRYDELNMTWWMDWWQTGQPVRHEHVGMDLDYALSRAGGKAIVLDATRTDAERKPNCHGGMWCRCKTSTPCYPGTVDAPVKRVVNPLAPEHRLHTGLSRSAKLAMPTEIQAGALSDAVYHPCTAGHIARGGRPGQLSGPSLRAMARRGWLELDDNIRPAYGTVTDAGRKALAYYQETHA